MRGFNRYNLSSILCFRLARFACRAGFLAPADLASKMLGVQRHSFLGVTHVLALQSCHEGKPQKLSALLGALCLVRQLKEFTTEPLNLLAKGTVSGESVLIARPLMPTLRMFPPPCFEMCTMVAALLAIGQSRGHEHRSRMDFPTSSAMSHASADNPRIFGCLTDATGLTRSRSINCR